MAACVQELFLIFCCRHRLLSSRCPCGFSLSQPAQTEGNACQPQDAIHCCPLKLFARGMSPSLIPTHQCDYVCRLHRASLFELLSHALTHTDLSNKQKVISVFLTNQIPLRISVHGWIQVAHDKFHSSHFLLKNVAKAHSLWVFH